MKTNSDLVKELTAYFRTRFEFDQLKEFKHMADEFNMSYSDAVKNAIQLWVNYHKDKL